MNEVLDAFIIGQMDHFALFYRLIKKVMWLTWLARKYSNMHNFWISLWRPKYGCFWRSNVWIWKEFKPPFFCRRLLRL